uniref:Uncharacterized protein n=1 Tax=Rhizophora mucronata TaxID=61149 RepID=A0A2P2MMN6_RHIMU
MHVLVAFSSSCSSSCSSTILSFVCPINVIRFSHLIFWILKKEKIFLSHIFYYSGAFYCQPKHLHYHSVTFTFSLNL